jgi:ankyrin repeat protein
VAVRPEDIETAVAFRRPAVLRRLLQQSDGTSPALDRALARAVRERGTDILAILLAANPPVPVKSRALVVAARAGRETAARALLAAGAEVNGREGGATPLIAAVEGGLTDFARELAVRGADVNARFTGPGEMSEDRFPLRDGGWTALHWAAAGGRPEAVRVLLAAGADPNVKTGRGRTAAACASDPESFQRLRAAGGKGGVTPEGQALIAAASRGDIAEMRRRLRAGVEVDSSDQYGRTALIAAAEEGRAEAVRALLAAGADVNATSYFGYSALSRAANFDHPEIVTLLKQAGADPRLAQEMIGGYPAAPRSAPQ